MSKVLNGVRIALCTLAALVLVAAFALSKNDVKRAEAFNVTAYGEKVETTLPEDITLEELKAMYIELAGKYNDLIDENADLAKHVEILEQEVSNVYAEYNALREETNQTKAALEAELANVQAERIHWEERYVTAASERDYYYEQIWGLENDVEFHKQNAQEWADMYNEAKTNYEAAQDEINLLEINIAKASERINALELEVTHMQELQDRILELSAREHELMGDVEYLKTMLDRKEAQYTAKVEELNAAEAALDSATANYEEELSKIQAEKAKLEVLNGKDKIALAEEITRLQNEKAALQAEIETLRNVEKDAPVETPEVSINTTWFKDNAGWLIAGGIIVCAALFIIVPSVKRAY